MGDFIFKKPEEFFVWLNNSSDEEIWEYINAWHRLPESTQQIIDFICYVKSKQNRVEISGSYADCSGTGGDGSNTFNISTAAAFVAAACGVSIAKHGARKTVGSSGSVDVLERLNVKFSSEPDQILDCLKKNKLAFVASKMSAELFKRVKKVVVEHRSSSFLSFVGPCSNPIPITHQVVGVGKPEWIFRMAELLKSLGRKRALIVHGTHDSGGMDELSLSGKSLVREIRRNVDGTYKDEEYEITPEQFGLSRVNISELRGGNAEENAARIESIFKHNGNKHDVDIVALNAASIVYVSGVASSFRAAVTACRDSIANGKALAKLSELQIPCS